MHTVWNPKKDSKKKKKDLHLGKETHHTDTTMQGKRGLSGKELRGAE